MVSLNDLDVSPFRYEVAELFGVCDPCLRTLCLSVCAQGVTPLNCSEPMFQGMSSLWCGLSLGVIFLEQFQNLCPEFEVFLLMSSYYLEPLRGFTLCAPECEISDLCIPCCWGPKLLGGVSKGEVAPAGGISVPGYEVFHLLGVCFQGLRSLSSLGFCYQFMMSWVFEGSVSRLLCLWAV